MIFPNCKATYKYMVNPLVTGRHRDNDHDHNDDHDDNDDHDNDDHDNDEDDTDDDLQADRPVNRKLSYVAQQINKIVAS